MAVQLNRFFLHDMAPGVSHWQVRDQTISGRTSVLQCGLPSRAGSGRAGRRPPRTHGPQTTQPRARYGAPRAAARAGRVPALALARGAAPGDRGLGAGSPPLVPRLSTPQVDRGRAGKRLRVCK
jgi:hypothetical protein